MRLKLVSYSHDTLLGHIDVPDYWREWMDRGHVTAVIPPRLPLSMFDHASNEIVMPEIKQVIIARAYGSQYRDAVYLARGSIEEFEAMDGCGFTPSMAYLRSQLS